MSTRHAIFDVDGASCAGCVFTIEHAGRKLRGVKDVRVDAATRQIHVCYEGEPAVLDGIVSIVTRIGYTATLKTADAPEAGA